VKTPTVLVVEDNTRQTVRLSPELEGSSGAMAEDGQAGRRGVERSPPALVLLNMKMPFLEG
jgi:DNA-binding response OmpR family regulator